jgi:hypothetical protein
MIKDDWYSEYKARKEKRKAYLNKNYPNKLIQNIDIEHLRKIGYAIGLGSTDTKKEFIDRIIQKQSSGNPIIVRNSNGEFLLNREVDLLYYITN